MESYILCFARWLYTICCIRGAGRDTMMIVYDSLTGNIKRFVKKLNVDCLQINETMRLEESFVLLTYTTGRGNVPEKVARFLEINHLNLVGVSASGNRNWGDFFGVSADRIAEQYHVPIISKFELSGTKKDVDIFLKGVGELEILRTE